MELTFAVAAVIAAAGLLFGLDVAERRRGFAVLALLGAKRNEIAAFLWSEALVVVGPGLAAFAARAPSRRGQAAWDRDACRIAHGRMRGHGR